MRIFDSLHSDRFETHSQSCHRYNGTGVTCTCARTGAHPATRTRHTRCVCATCHMPVASRTLGRHTRHSAGSRACVAPVGQRRPPACDGSRDCATSYDLHVDSVDTRLSHAHTRASSSGGSIEPLAALSVRPRARVTTCCCIGLATLLAAEISRRERSLISNSSSLAGCAHHRRTPVLGGSTPTTLATAMGPPTMGPADSASLSTPLDTSPKPNTGVPAGPPGCAEGTTAGA